MIVIILCKAETYLGEKLNAILELLPGVVFKTHNNRYAKLNLTDNIANVFC